MAAWYLWAIPDPFGAGMCVFCGSLAVVYVAISSWRSRPGQQQCGHRLEVRDAGSFMYVSVSCGSLVAIWLYLFLVGRHVAYCSASQA